MSGKAAPASLESSRNQASLEQERTQLVDDVAQCVERCEAIANSMDRSQIKLIVGLDRDEAHVFALHRFGDRLCIHGSRSCWDFTNGFTNWAAISRTSS